MSKALLFLLSPSTWLLFSLGFYFYLKNGKWKNRMKWTAIIVFLLFSNSVIFSFFCAKWEIPGNKIGSVKKHDVAIVLGGMTQYNNDIQSLSMRREGDRIFHAIRLYKRKQVKKIMISGDSGYITDRGLHEAKQMKEILIEMGIPEKDIITEEKSVNTHENAKETTRILKQLHPELHSYLLITSGMHMRRSLGCFKKQGMTCTPYSVDLYANQSGNYFWDQYFIPSFDNLINWNKLLKEVVGFMVYDVVGYI